VDTDDRLITNGQTLNGTINPANDTDTYTFNASAGQRATITMRKSSGNLDSYLTLLKPPDNSSLISDDDGGGNRDSLINNVSLPSSGTYKIITRSYNNSSAGGYTINLSITNPSINCPGQYKAEYYNNRSGSGNPTFIRCESWPISNNWGTGGPGNGVGNDNFFVRWTGQSNFSSGSYRFLARADDGIRVYFDNQQIINGWKDQSATDYSTTMSVNSGNHDVKIEYYENGGDAVAQFRWTRTKIQPI
jgi:hypothetical protein